MMLNHKHIHRRFERAASTLDGSDFVHATSREGLLRRLQPLLIDAKTVVDLGAGTGAAGLALGQRFKGARLISIDIALGMLLKARQKKRWLSKANFIQANAVALPLANDCIDVVFANLLLPWVDDPAPVFAEVARILHQGGVFAFATLGPDSLQELRRAWAAVDDDAHVNRFPDMHNLGDALVNSGLRDPVLDVDRLSIAYQQSGKLFTDLTAVGARNALQQRARGLTGKRRYAAMLAALNDATGAGKLTLELELVFGHCWGGGPKLDASHYEIDARKIPVRHRGAIR